MEYYLEEMILPYSELHGKEEVQEMKEKHPHMHAGRWKRELEFNT